jgi:hypothetical protein
MAVKKVGSSHFVLAIGIFLGVATLGLCSVIPLENSAADVAVLPLSVKDLSSTTLDDPLANVTPIVAAAASWTNNISSRSFEECGVANSNSLLSAASDDGGSSRIVGGETASPNEFPWQAYLNVEMTMATFIVAEEL